MPHRSSNFKPILLSSIALVTSVGPAPAYLEAQGCEKTHPARIALLAGGYATITTTAIALRHDVWWITPRTGFHVAWGESPSRGQDRLLHATVSYHTSQLGALAWEWACVSPTTASWLGAASALAFQLPKEIGDGLHQDQGFSASDMLFATGGALLPALHRQVPSTRVFQLKLSYWPSEELRHPAPFPTLENDYAGQRYFLALNPGLIPGGVGPWPDWLGMALGHSVSRWALGPGEHQWYLTLDLNLRGLPIRGSAWKTFATLVDQLHLPLPGIRLQQGDVALGLF